MKKLLGTLAVLSLSATFAAPALAQMDVGAMTCGAFFALDAAGQGDATNAIMNFVKDTANAGVVGTAAESMANMAAADVTAQIDKACEGQPVDTNLLSVLQ